MTSEKWKQVREELKRELGAVDVRHDFVASGDEMNRNFCAICGKSKTWHDDRNKQTTTTGNQPNER